MPESGPKRDAVAWLEKLLAMGYEVRLSRAEASEVAAGLNALRAELKGLRGYEPRVKGLTFDASKGEVSATMVGQDFSRWMACWMAETHREQGAANYVEWRVHHENGSVWVCTIQREDGRTAHDLRREAEAERDMLRARLAAATARDADALAAIIDAELPEGAGAARAALRELRELVAALRLAPNVEPAISTELIAKVCHEVNRAYCETVGDTSQLPWEDAPAWQRESSINGVEHARMHPDAKPSDNHDAWLAEKVAAGWRYGPVKDPAKKEHPCLVAFTELPPEQQAKSVLFLAVARALLR